MSLNPASESAGRAGRRGVGWGWEWGCRSAGESRAESGEDLLSTPGSFAPLAVSPVGETIDRRKSKHQMASFSDFQPSVVPLWQVHYKPICILELNSR